MLISYESLKRGWAEADERCEIAGVGPISVATARSLMADAFGAAIGCGATTALEIDHIEDWRHTLRTKLDQLS